MKGNTPIPLIANPFHSKQIEKYHAPFVEGLKYCCEKRPIYTQTHTKNAWKWHKVRISQHTRINTPPHTSICLRVPLFRCDLIQLSIDWPKMPVFHCGASNKAAILSLAEIHLALFSLEIAGIDPRRADWFRKQALSPIHSTILTGA